MEKKQFSFHKKVYLGDTNAEGNVYFAEYFVWQGQAREEFVQKYVPEIAELFKAGLVILTKEASIKYKHSAYLYDEIEITIKTANIEHASLDLIFSFVNKKTDEEIATGRQKLVFADQAGKIIHIPQEIQEKAFAFSEESLITK